MPHYRCRLAVKPVHEASAICNLFPLEYKIFVVSKVPQEPTLLTVYFNGQDDMHHTYHRDDTVSRSVVPAKLNVFCAT
jgi:hypothetical protein